jgi:hypothetical protein
MIVRALAPLVCLLSTSIAAADDDRGSVRVPLDVYQGLIDAAKGSDPKSSRFALGEATMSLEVDEHGAATAHVELTVKIVGEDWTLVPLLPPGTAVTIATDGGSPAQLVPTQLGLAFGSNVAGEHRLVLEYAVEVRKTSEDGRMIVLPLSAAAGTKLTATIPGEGLDVGIVPAASFSTQSSGAATVLSATIPSAAGAQIAWRTGARTGFALSRARYTGRLEGDSIAWEAVIEADVFGGDVELPLLPSAVTLSGLRVDGKPGTVLFRDERFATLVRGRGHHEIAVSFETPVSRESGPPKTSLSIPEIPISRFDLRLPGKKALSVTPAAAVRARFDKEGTLATIHAPMTAELELAWSEAVPEEVEEEVRSNATVYHAAHAEEGVLHARATIEVDVTRGSTSIVELEVPSDVQVNRITADNGSVSDWRVTDKAKVKLVSVFFDRKISGPIKLDVRYELLAAGGPNAPDILPVPLLRMVDVHRQRGMVALLSSQEMSLKPTEQKNLSKVGENQLPAFFRGGLEMTIAHTFKYGDPSGVVLSVQTVAPERKQAKFDGEVDTLLSLSDVTMKGSATVRINVKSGKVDVLRLELPADVTILNVTAPSKRSHAVKVEGAIQAIDLYFTQEMEGEFPIDVDYERILSTAEPETTVPIVRVIGAEPEQGRIAVEALTAVEVKASTADQLSVVDVGELPKQLVLKTRNPIRLAYKYVQAGHRLGLEITRHKEIETQIATIERAHYRTLFTRDGLAVTTATFLVKNSRKQFLELCLPSETEIWSVFVDNKAEKPALDAKATEACKGLGVLVKVINSAQGFPVELVYRTKVAEIGRLGTVKAALPRPDMVVTNTRWDVFLPDEISYEEPESNMHVVVSGQRIGRIESPAAGLEGDQALRVSVPMSGVQFSFEKLYANQSEEEARIAIPFRSSEGDGLATLASIAGTIAFWAGLFFLVRRGERVSLRAARSVCIGGAIGVIAATSLLGASLSAPVLSSAAVLLGFAAYLAYPRFRARFRP